MLKEPISTIQEKEVGTGWLPQPSPKSRLNRNQALMGYLFISPAMVLFLVFALLPAAVALGLSFTDYDILNPAKWVGLKNYSRLLGDDLFFTSLRNILYYSLLYVPLMIFLSLGLAMALNRKVPGMSIFRVIYYFPMITSAVAASTVWVWMFNRDYGVINQLLGFVGINGPAWLSNSDTAMLAVVFVTLWQGLGGNMIIYLAGLKGIPEYLYEAAVLDGANHLQLFQHITWPTLRNTTFFVVTLALIGSFQLFDQAYVMTQGGPGHATLIPVYTIYNSGFNRLQMGYASSQAFVLFLIILVVSLINTRINREQDLV